MVPQSEQQELLAAWRALDGHRAAEGWRTIPVAPNGPCRLLAGRHFPGNEEALLVGFASIGMPPASQLPQGVGFLVSAADLGKDSSGRGWIALARKSAGSLDLFTMMTVDVMSTLEAMRGADDQNLMRAFLARIRAWQDFMRRGGESLLSPEAEVGLFGELEILLELIRCGLPVFVCVDAWRGPLGGIHDFSLGTGAIEVKTTVAPTGFPAIIGSLEQLDDSLIRPLFVGAARLALDSTGLTLAEQVAKVREAMRQETAAAATFNSLLLHAGFIDTVAERYTRRFVRTAMCILPVSTTFPRLTRANVPVEISKACYEVDLESAGVGDTHLGAALRHLGVT